MKGNQCATGRRNRVGLLIAAARQHHNVLLLRAVVTGSTAAIIYLGLLDSMLGLGREQEGLKNAIALVLSIWCSVVTTRYLGIQQTARQAMTQLDAINRWAHGTREFLKRRHGEPMDQMVIDRLFDDLDTMTWIPWELWAEQAGEYDYDQQAENRKLREIHIRETSVSSPDVMVIDRNKIDSMPPRILGLKRGSHRRQSAENTPRAYPANADPGFEVEASQ